MKKSELALKVKRGTGQESVKALFDLIDMLIAEDREANDSNRGEEFLVTQGGIKRCKDLKDILSKKEKS